METKKRVVLCRPNVARASAGTGFVRVRQKYGVAVQGGVMPDWSEFAGDIQKFFSELCIELGLCVSLDFGFLEDAPVDGFFVYGEAFPSENRVWLEVVALDASRDEIGDVVCHELVHIMYPELNHGSVEFSRHVESVKEKAGCLLAHFRSPPLCLDK